MASDIIYGSTSNSYIESKIEWSSTANTTANTSTVTASLYYKRTNTGYKTYGTGTFSVTIDGTKTSVTKELTIESAWVKAVSATKTVTHSDNGSKSISISAAGSISGTTLTATSCSGTAKLDTIARASTLTSASSVTLGNKCSVKWTPLSKSFRYKLKFSLGSWSYTTGAIHPNTTSAYTYTGYTIPLDAARQITTAKTGTMTVTLYTYSNSDATTQVGSASSKTFTVTIPDNADTKPYVTDMTVSPVSSLESSFAGLFIQSISKVKVSSTDVGQYGATIVEKSVMVEGNSYGSSSDYTSNHLYGYGNINVKLTIKDSRGITNSKTVSITVIPYSKPRVVPVTGENSVVCGRCDANGNWSDSGTYLKIKARRSYSLCMVNGVQKNFCGLRYRYKKVTDSDYGSWITLISNTNTTTEEVITAPLLNGTISATTSYVVQVDAVDSIPNHTYITFDIPTEEVYMHKAGSIGSLGIGEYVEDSNIISVAKNKSIRLKSSINGVRMYNKSVSGTAELDINTKYSDFTGTGNERQNFFVFGEANGYMVYGVARVANNGTTKWAGTEGVTLKTKTGGVLTVVLPTTAYDIFTIISGRDFSV
jgi:hypothetical protein